MCDAIVHYLSYEEFGCLSPVLFAALASVQLYEGYSYFLALSDEAGLYEQPLLRVSLKCAHVAHRRADQQLSGALLSVYILQVIELLK